MPEPPAAAPPLGPVTRSKHPRVWPTIPATVLIMLGSSVFASIGAVVALLMLPTSFTSTLPADWRTRLLMRKYGAMERMTRAVTAEPLFVVLLIAGSAFIGAMLVILLVVVRGRSGPWRARLGLTPGCVPVQDFTLLVAAELGAGFVIGGLFAGALQHLHLLPPFGEGRTILVKAMLAAPRGLKIAFVIAGSLMTGVYEELLFRGYLQRGLLAKWRPVTALIVTACFFAVMHGDIAYAVFVLPSGLWLGYLAWRADSVLPGSVCHVCINTIGQSTLAIFGTSLGPKMLSCAQALARVHMLWPFIIVAVSLSVGTIGFGVRCVEKRVRSQSAQKRCCVTANREVVSDRKST